MLWMVSLEVRYFGVSPGADHRPARSLLSTLIASGMDVAVIVAALTCLARALARHSRAWAPKGRGPARHRAPLTTWRPGPYPRIRASFMLASFDNLMLLDLYKHAYVMGTRRAKG